jgi:hypothetical protein
VSKESSTFITYQTTNRMTKVKFKPGMQVRIKTDENPLLWFSCSNHYSSYKKGDIVTLIGYNPETKLWEILIPGAFKSTFLYRYHLEPLNN